MTTNEPQARVLFFDPITWTEDWDYSGEQEALAPLGVQVVMPPDRTARDRELANADVVVVSSIDQLTAEHIEKLTRCVGILCYSAGMDAVDLDAAERSGIPVTNVRSGTGDVADHAMTLLLAAWRRLPRMISEAAKGHWELEQHPDFREIPRIAGKTLGIFGAGAIGQALAARARAFEMRTVATYRRSFEATSALPHVPLEGLVAESDALALTASLNPTTRGIINHELLSGARHGLVLVNVARGGLVVEDDLVKALDAGIVSVAALDVRDPEPPDPSNDPLGTRSDVIQTPHSAGVSSEALSSLHRLAADEIISLLRDGGRI